MPDEQQVRLMSGRSWHHVLAAAAAGRRSGRAAVDDTSASERPRSWDDGILHRTVQQTIHYSRSKIEY